jgi:hypothetical protein
VSSPAALADELGLQRLGEDEAAAHRLAKESAAADQQGKQDFLSVILQARLGAVQDTLAIADWKNRNPMNRSPSTEVVRVRVRIEETI